MKIIGISGSIKQNGISLNTSLINAASELVPEGSEFEIIDISTLPLYSEDLEADYPAAAKDLKEKVGAADAVVIATPEHNRSMPAALVNAISWISRPYGTSAWNGKPMLLMGATGGALGTYGAQHHLRDSMAHNGAYVLPEPALHIVFAGDKVEEGNKLTDQDTRDHIKAALERLVAYAAQLSK